MESIGMVINQTKNEVTLFSLKDYHTIKLNSDSQSAEPIKALGEHFDSHMSWNNYIQKVLARTSQTVKLIKNIGRWISTENALKIVTNHYFGQSYYCSPVWMNCSLSFENWNRLKSQCNRVLWAAIGDFKPTIPWSDLNMLCKSAIPWQMG